MQRQGERNRRSGRERESVTKETVRNREGRIMRDWEGRRRKRYSPTNFVFVIVLFCFLIVSFYLFILSFYLFTFQTKPIMHRV